MTWSNFYFLRKTNCKEWIEMGQYWSQDNIGGCGICLWSMYEDGENEISFKIIEFIELGN